MAARNLSLAKSVSAGVCAVSAMCVAREALRGETAFCHMRVGEVKDPRGRKAGAVQRASRPAAAGVSLRISVHPA